MYRDNTSFPTAGRGAALPRKVFPWEKSPEWFEFGCLTARPLNFWVPVAISVLSYGYGLYLFRHWATGVFDFEPIQPLEYFPGVDWEPPENHGLGTKVVPVALTFCILNWLICGAAAGVVAYRAKYEAAVTSHWIFFFVLVTALSFSACGFVLSLQAWTTREGMRHSYECNHHEMQLYPDICRSLKTWKLYETDRRLTLFLTSCVISSLSFVVIVLQVAIVMRAICCPPFQYPEIPPEAGHRATKDALDMTSFQIAAVQQQQLQQQQHEMHPPPSGLHPLPMMNPCSASFEPQQNGLFVPKRELNNGYYVEDARYYPSTTTGW